MRWRGRGAEKPAAGPRGRRRDRHGRGLRGALAPATVPLGRTRAERFDDLVVDAYAEVAAPYAVQLSGVEVAVEDVPPEGSGGVDVRGVALGRVDPATRRRAARLVLYRRPIEARSRTLPDREDLVHDVVVGLVSDLLGLDPDEVDPDPPA